MRDNYENSDISIISKEPTWKTWIISKGPTWSYWVRPRRPVRQLQKLAGGSDLIWPEQVVFFIFASAVFYLRFIFAVFYICRTEQFVVIIPLPPSLSTSQTWPRISYWALSDVRSQKKLANSDFVAQTFCSRNK